MPPARSRRRSSDSRAPMRPIAPGVSVLVAIAALSHGACARSNPPAPFGFGQESGRAQLALEARFLDLPDATRVRDAHRLLTLRPHPAGSPRDRELADWTAQQFRGAGLDDGEITTHDVLLPQPVDVAVDMILPQVWRASMRELPAEGDLGTGGFPAPLRPPQPPPSRP